MRIAATSIRKEYASATAGTQLRAQGIAALRTALVTDEAAPRYIYEGLLSREQAARGAVIGQYVRMQQSTSELNPLDNESLAVDADIRAVARRDLIESMLLQMVGAGAEPLRGTCVTQVI